MRKVVIIIFCCIAAFTIQAQSFEKWKNTQLEIHAKQQNNTALYASSEPLIFFSERNTISQLRVSKIFPTGYTLAIQTSHIDGKLIAFGKEQLFNSDDTTASAFRDSLFLLTKLNKELEFTINQNQQIQNNDSSSSFLMIMENEPDKYLLPIKKEQIKLGYGWSDSTISTNSKSINQYVITKSNNDFFELTVYKELQQKNTLQKDGQSIVQQLKGFVTTVRWYNSISCILQSEKTTTQLSGSTIMGDQSLPITISIQNTVQVIEKK